MLKLLTPNIECLFPNTILTKMLNEEWHHMDRDYLLVKIRRNEKLFFLFLNQNIMLKLMGTKIFTILCSKIVFHLNLWKIWIIWKPLNDS